MLKRIRKVVLVLFGLIIFLFLTAVLLAYIFEDKITGKIKDQLNQQLSVPVQVNGGIHLSLIKHFPYASVIFSKVEIDDKLQKNKNLVHVEEISLLCNLFSLLGDKVELSKILIKDGDINIYKNEKGETNYDIIKPSQDTAKAKFSILLKKAEVKDVRVTYFDKSEEVKGDIFLKNLFLKGDFSNKQFDMSTSINGTINSIFSNGQELLAKRSLKSEITLDVNNETRRFTFKKGNIELDGNEFSITGFFAMLDRGIQLDFKLLNEGKDIQKLFGLCPDKYKSSFANAEGRGQYVINAEVKGMVSNSSFPHISVSANLKNSEIKLGKFNKLLKKVNATAKYELDDKGGDKLVISNFDCTLNELPFAFKLSLTKLGDPDFDFYAQGVFHMSELSTFVPDSIIRDWGGTINFENFHLKGRKKDFTDPDNSTMVGAGQFKLNAIEFQQNGISYGNINGALRYNNQTIEAQNLTANFLSTEAGFSGNINNLPAFIYNLSSNRNANNVVLVVNGALKVQTLNLSGLIDAYSKKNRPKNYVPKGRIDLREIVNMQGNLDIDIKKFIFRKLEFDNLRGNLQVSPGIIQANNLQMQAMDGDVRLNAKLLFGDDYSINMISDVTSTGLNVSKIFYECENFGQAALTDKHLKGTLSAAISFNAKWNNYSELDQKSLSAIVDFNIKNGELMKFEALKAASKFIRVDELQDIKFADISNIIKIGNQRIDIPQFQIESSALNLMFEGYHYFNNTIDYHLKINLHKLLAQKFNRKLQNDIQYMETDPYEGLNLYLSMSGDLSNPKIKYDKASARKKIQNDFKQEKNNLRNLFNNVAPTVDANEKKKETKYYNIQETPQFMDFDTTGK
ncbi:MAG: hypothetical protein JWO06_1961 [Bacteroidota bacterium]|nr:hypothetical protein [Bacteroidota bacterium]